MTLVLAVEPHAGQAEILRRIVGGLDGVELMLVDSAEAVAATVASRVPRLLLVASSLSQQARALAVDHYLLACDINDPPVLDIPRLSKSEGGGKGRKKTKATAADIEAFAAAIRTCLAPALQQSEANPSAEPDAGEEVFLEVDELAESEPRIDPAAHAEALKAAQNLADARLVAELDTVRREAEARHAAELERLRAEAEARVVAEVGEARARAVDEHRTALTAAVDEAVSRAVDEAVARVRAEAAEHLAAQLAEADKLRHAAEARTLAEIERIRSGSAEQLETQLARVREETAAAAARAEAADSARAQATAAAEAIRSEAEARHQAALAQAAGEIESARQSQQAAQRDAEAARLALTEAQAAHQSAIDKVKADAARAETARAEHERRHQAELERAHQATQQIRQELEQAGTTHRAALEQLRAEAKREKKTHADELTRAEAARTEAEARHHAELDQVRQELTQVRQELDHAQHAHHSAMEQLKQEAARAAAAHLDAESGLRTELQTAHQELKQLRQEMEQARVAHRTALDQLRAEAERDSRTRAEEAARAETVRIDTEFRHRAELERAQQELQQAREGMEQARAESRAWAEETIRTEVARLTAEADARVATEVAAVRAEAEQRRVAGLAALRAQLDNLTGNTRQAGVEPPAETPAPPPIAVDAPASPSVIVAPPAPPIAAEEPVHAYEATDPGPAEAATPRVRQMAVLAAGGGRIAVQGLRLGVKGLRLGAHGLRVGGQTALPVARRVIGWLPGRMVPVGLLLLVVGVVALGDVSALAQRGTSAALSASRKAATLLGIGAEESEADEEAASVAVDGTGDEPADESAAPQTSGLLQVFSRVPLEVHLGGRRIGTSGEREILLPPGRHRVEFVNRQLNYRGEATVTIRSAAFTTYNVTLPMGSLLIETDPGAEIFIEGKAAGVAPVGVISAPLGTSEVVVRHPEHGERRELVDVRHGVRTELRVTFPPASNPAAPAIDSPPAEAVPEA